MTAFLYKWLPIVFGCHCMDSRSFHFKGRKFPICARCTGELLGMVVCAALFPFLHFNAVYSFFALIPLMADGFIQRLTKYESNNFKRVVTGFLFGWGGLNLFLLSLVYTYNLGLNVGEKIFG